MPEALTLRVITPDAIVLDTPVDSVKVPAVDGLMGILPRHAHMVAALDVGDLTFSAVGQTHHVFVSGGFVEVRNNTVRIVSEAGESPEDIDEERAAQAEARARKRLDERMTEGAEGFDLLRAELALKRALFRQRVRRSHRS